MNTRLATGTCLVAIVLAACSTSSSPGGAPDAGFSSDTGTTFEAGGDDGSAPEATVEAGVDATTEAAAEASTEASVEASVDAEAGVPGLVAWWRAEGNTNDSAGSYNGTAEGSLTYVAGKVGQAFSLPGASVDVGVPDGIIPASAREYTIAAWTWLDAAATTNQQHWIFYAGSTAGELSLTFDSNDLIDFSVHGSDANWYGAYSSTAPVPGVWSSVVGIRRATGGTDASAQDTVELWIDGSMVGSAGIPTNIGSYVESADAGTPSSSSIGGYNRNASQWWQGKLDEIKIFNRALSQAEIQAL
jgi:hypothetical protein